MPEPEAEVVEVAYARPDRQRIVAIPLVEGMTARDAVEVSGLAREFPEIGTRPLVLGIFGRRCAAEEVLTAGDRVEIYRPLRADPRDTRRRLAAQGRTMARPPGASDR